MYKPNDPQPWSRINLTFAKASLTFIFVLCHTFICRAQFPLSTDKPIPYLVAILDKEDHQFICTGTIIDKQWILTSANPLAGQRLASEIVVAVGDFNCFNIQPEDLLIEVEEYWYGTGYDKPMEAYNSTLLKLKEPLAFDDQKVHALNMMDVQFNQMGALAEYLYPNDETLAFFLESIKPLHQFAAGFDIYGNKTMIEVDEGIIDFEEDFFDEFGLEEEPETELVDGEDWYEEEPESWFGDWAKILQWSGDESTNNKVQQLLDENLESDDPVNQPFFQPTRQSDNILTHGFTGGPLVSQSTENSLPLLSGVATWWTLNELPEGILSSSLQGDPEAVWAIKRWYDYTPLMSTFVQAVTAEGSSAGLPKAYTGLGNNPPTMTLAEQLDISWEVFGGQGYGDLEFQAREIRSWQNLNNAQGNVIYKPSEHAILEPGFWVRSGEPDVRTLEVDEETLARFHVEMQPAVTLVNYLGAMMATASTSFDSPLGTFLLFYFFKDAWMPFVTDLPPQAPDATNSPPIISFTGSGMDTSSSQARNYEKEESDRPEKRPRTDNNESSGGDGDDGNGGNNGGDGDDDGDDEMKDDVEVNPENQQGLQFTFVHLMQIINWQFVEQNGGFRDLEPIYENPDLILDRLQACNLQYILGMVYTLRDRYGHNWMNNPHYLNREGVPYEMNEFLMQLIIALDRIAGDLIQHRNAGTDANTPLADQIRIDQRILAILRPFYGIVVGPLMGGVHFENALAAMTNHQFQGFNANGRNGLNIRVLEVLMRWADEVNTDDQEPNVEYFNRFDPNNPGFGVPPLVQRLIAHADFLTLEDPLNPLRNRIDQIRQIWNHFRRNNDGQIAPTGDELRYYNWRPYNAQDTNPVQRTQVAQQAGIPDLCQPQTTPWIPPALGCAQNENGTITIEPILDKITPEDLVQLKAIILSLVPLEDHDNPRAASWNAAYEQAYADLNSEIEFPKQVKAQIHRILILAISRNAQYIKIFHPAIDVIQKKYGIENYQAYVDMLNWLANTFYSEFFFQYALYEPDNPNSCEYWDLARLVTLAQAEPGVMREINQHRILESEWISAMLLEVLIDWQSYMYNQIQLNLPVKESLHFRDPRDKKLYKGNWEILQHLIIGSGRRCINISFDERLINEDHRAYLDEIIEEVRRDYQRLGHNHREWRDIPDPAPGIFNFSIRDKITLNWDRYFQIIKQIDNRLNLEDNDPFSYWIKLYDSVIRYSSSFLVAAILDPYTQQPYINATIDKASSLREIPYRLSLDLGMFIRHFQEDLTHLINTGRLGANRFDANRMPIEKLRQMFRILFWMRNDNLEDRRQLPIGEDPDFRQQNPELYEQVKEFVNWMFTVYIPDHIDGQTYQPNKGYEGLRFNNEPINLTLYHEIRYSSYARLAMLINWERFFNTHRDMHEALGCLYNYIGSVFYRPGTKLLMDEFATYHLIRSKEVAGLSAIYRHFKNNPLSRENLQRPPDAFWYFHRNPTREELLGEELLRCIEEEDEKKDDDDQANQRTATHATVDSLMHQSTTLYPNPNSGNFSISGLRDEPLDYRITVTNLNGHIIHEFKLEDFMTEAAELRMELQHLPAGIYVLNITSGDGKIESLKFRITY